MSDSLSRRALLQVGAIGLGAMAVGPPLLWTRDETRIKSGQCVQKLVRTAWQTKGPFYPSKLPLDTDNDLLIINDTITPAVGTITHLSGRVLDATGAGVKNAVVEIWQVDSSGMYLHPRSNNHDRRDRHFQGFGRFLTGRPGRTTSARSSLSPTPVGRPISTSE